MKSRIAVKYITVYIFFNLSGIFLAQKFWWTDGLKLSYFGVEFAGLLASVILCWFGIVYLSIYIARKIKIKPDSFGFLGPLDIGQIEFLSKPIDPKVCKKISTFISYTTIPTLIATMYIFVMTMKQIKIYQLQKFGVIQSVKIVGIENSKKGIPYVILKYGNGQTIRFVQGELKLGDDVKIIYSTNNEEIVERYLN